MADPGAAPPSRRGGTSRASAIGVYVVLLIVLQIYLLSVALDAFHARDRGLAWNAAGLSVGLTSAVVVVARLLRR